MTRDEIDIMWQQAMQESIKDGEMFTRYHFAEMVTEAERERIKQANAPEIEKINAHIQKAMTALEEALADPMREVQRLGQEIEPDDMASILACRDMLDAQPVPPRTWVGLTDEDMYVVSEEESCSFIAGAKWSEAILKEKNTICSPFMISELWKLHK